MIILLEYAWPWILIGGLLTAWGYGSLGVTLSQFLSVMISLLFSFFSDDTKQEKSEAKQPMDEVVTANPGCILFMTGLALIVFGVIRWLW